MKQILTFRVMGALVKGYTGTTGRQSRNEGKVSQQNIPFSVLEKKHLLTVV